ncbi:MAG: hypothetical protein LWX07_10585, partial [Bacteroidetes bacterium]|nr:hypothetical protein [Bacteroidota bacterium]
MKTIIFNLSVIFISLSFIAGIKAQDDTTGMNEASTTIKINIDDLTIPKEIRAGESFDFSIKIQNISKFSEWTSNYLTFDNEP